MATKTKNQNLNRSASRGVGRGVGREANLSANRSINRAKANLVTLILLLMAGFLMLFGGAKVVTTHSYAGRTMSCEGASQSEEDICRGVLSTLAETTVAEMKMNDYFIVFLNFGIFACITGAVAYRVHASIILSQHEVINKVFKCFEAKS